MPRPRVLAQIYIKAESTSSIPQFGNIKTPIAYEILAPLLISKMIYQLNFQITAFKQCIFMWSLISDMGS